MTRPPRFRPALAVALSLATGVGVARAGAQELDATARLMRDLTEAPGPSGFEDPVRNIVVDAYEALGAAIEYDGLGSVLATLPSSPEGPRVMVTAHLDEVGLMVQHVTPDGFILVKNLGGWLDQAFPDQRWTILGRSGPVTALSGLPTVHVMPPAQRSRLWSLTEIFLDVGARTSAEVEALGVRPGDGIAPMSPFTVLPNGRYAAKAWDDRVGLAVMIVAARRIRDEGIRVPARIVWVATTQEEVGLRGAQTSVDLADPDLGISIEADLPGASWRASPSCSKANSAAPRLSSTDDRPSGSSPSKRPGKLRTSLVSATFTGVMERSTLPATGMPSDRTRASKGNRTATPSRRRRAKPFSALGISTAASRGRIAASK